MKTVIPLLTIITAICAQDTETARQIWDNGFRQKRPAPTRLKPAPPRTPEYKPARPLTTPMQPTGLIGITMWKLRMPDEKDGRQPRILVPANPYAPAQELVQQRMRPDESLKEGQYLRISIETPVDGYLYVIDREIHRGSASEDAVLIFPSAQQDNQVTAGRLIDIPAQADPLPALRLLRAGNDHVGEELIIVVLPQPARKLPNRDSMPVKLPSALIADWDRQAASVAERLDEVANFQPWTFTEQEASGKKRDLTQSDPMPQSIYRVPLSNGGLALKLKLSIN